MSSAGADSTAFEVDAPMARVGIISMALVVVSLMAHSGAGPITPTVGAPTIHAEAVISMASAID
jgi:hypothetical protein